MFTLRGFFFLYFVICWFCSSGAQLNPPSDRLVFAPGEDGRIVWTYSGDTNEITVQTLRFTGVSPYLVLAARGKVVDRVSNGLDFQFVLPLTLILKNVNQTYNGTYTMEVGLESGTLPRSPVHVFIAVAPKISINCSSTTILNVSDYFSCECKGEDGNPPAVVTWYKDSRRIISGEEMATLTIARVSRDDNGPYRCEAKGDEKAKAEKTVQIIVNSEPFNTKLTLTREGDKATLTCTAGGNPRPQFEIFLNGSSVVNRSELVINEVSTKDVGDYTCRATNNLGIQFSQKVNLPLKGMSTTTPSATDTDPKAVKSSDGGLGGGAIAGIVIGVLVVIIIIVVVVYFCVVKKNKDSRLGNSKSTAEYSKAADSADKDTHYAALDPVALNAGGSRPRADEPPPQTQYASIDHGATGSTKADLV